MNHETNIESSARRGKRTPISSTLVPPESPQRRTRSSTRREQDEEFEHEPKLSQMHRIPTPIPVLPSFPQPSTTLPSGKPAILPHTLTTSITGLPKRALALLDKKQALLHSSATQSRLHESISPSPRKRAPKEAKSNPSSTPSPSLLSAAISATLLFAQEHAGTAICIHSTGLILTCAHCIAESAAELDQTKRHWLLFSSGRVVEARCVAFDSRLDLALLRIVAAQVEPPSALSFPAPESLKASAASGAGDFTFPTIFLAATTPTQLAPLICIGHPGSEDLEAATPGVKSGYDVLHVSSGVFRGYAPGQDPLDNEEIGALRHDCWTYWGHSGAPLVEAQTGWLVGLHSSWDDETGMRRGVGWEAVKRFLGEERKTGDIGVEVVDLTLDE